MLRISKSLAVLAGLLAAFSVVTVLSGCGSSSKSKGSSQAELSGSWKVDVSFGSATLTVNKDGTLITAIKFTFDCGAATSASGSIGASDTSPGWPVDKAGSFALDKVPFYFNLMNDQVNTTASMSGQFAGGKSASGKWSLAVNDGTQCSADWTSSR